jgi:uncharacterized protein YbbC (DUF1343 family)
MHYRRRAGWRLWVTIAGSALAAGCAAAGGSHVAPAQGVRPGISVLLSDSLHLIRGRTIGLLTNQTGVDEHGESDIELLRSDRARAAGVRLATLFSPEHGIRGTEDRTNLASGIDERSGLVVNSLYTSTTIAPPDSTLRGIDALVVDLQDIGTRTWTYVGSMLYTMHAAARHHIPIIVLDRPNPLNAMAMSGPVLDPSLANPEEQTASRPARAYALYPAPLRHGMTMAELALFFNSELHVGVDLHVVPVSGWHRSQWFDETGLPWVRPSPNLPTLASATIYSALVAFEGTNVSVGRGTPDAFQRFGAPWMRADSVVALLNARHVPGVRFERSDFTPHVPGDNKYAERLIPGVKLVLTNRDEYHAGRTGAAVLWALNRTSHDSLVVRSTTFDERFGQPAIREALLRGEDPDVAVARDDAAVTAWRQKVAPFLLYR